LNLTDAISIEQDRLQTQGKQHVHLVQSPHLVEPQIQENQFFVLSEVRHLRKSVMSQRQILQLRQFGELLNLADLVVGKVEEVEFGSLETGRVEATYSVVRQIQRAQEWQAHQGNFTE